MRLVLRRTLPPLHAHLPACDRHPGPLMETVERTITHRGNRLIITFVYDQAVAIDVRQLPGRQLDPASKSWSCPIVARPAVLAFADRHGFTVDPDITAGRIVPRRPTERGSVMLDRGRGLLVVRTPPDAEMVADLGALPSRRWDANLSAWMVPQHLVRSVRALADAHGWRVAREVQDLEDVDPSIVPVNVTASGADLVIRSPYDADLIREFRSIGARWDQGRKAWMLPVEYGERLLRVLETAKVAMGADAETMLTQTIRMMEQIKASRALDAELVIPDFHVELRPFQRAGVVYATQLAGGRCIIGDSRGLGKTLQGLGTLQVAGAWPACVIVPRVVKIGWQREAQRAMPRLRVITLMGLPDRRTSETVAKWLTGDSPYGDTTLLRDVFQSGEHLRLRLDTMVDAARAAMLLPQADLIIVNYDVLGPTIRTKEEVDNDTYPDPGWTPILKAVGLRGLVADEVHRIRNPLTLRFRGCKEVASTIAAHDVVLGLSGTPVVNHRRELAAPLDFIGRLQEFGSYDAVGRMSDLAQRMRSRCLILRSKAEVMPELPPVEHAYIIIGAEDLDQGVMKQYAHAERDLLDFVAESARQIAVELGEDPDSAAVAARMRATGAQFLVKINVLRSLALKAKYKAARQWIKDFMLTEEKLLIFGCYLEPLHMFAAEFGCPEAIIEGKKSDAKRQALVDRFQTDEAMKLLFLQIDAGGEGITLTAASNVAFLQQAWSPAPHAQAVDRCHGRLNNPHGAVAHWLLAEDTIEEWISELLAAKELEADDAVNGDLADADDTDGKASVYSGLIDRLTARAVKR